jgi:ATP synthase protein I
MVRRVDTPAFQDFLLQLDGSIMSADGKGQDPQHNAGSGQISPEEREAIRQRSAEIGKKLDAVNSRRVSATASRGKSQDSAYGQAFKYIAELVVGVVAGVLLGGFLDKQFGTDPWLLVLFLILGFSAGLLNLIRGAQKAQAENEASQLAAPSVADDGDDDK